MAVFAAEGMLRLMKPYGLARAEGELVWFRDGEQSTIQRAFMLDADFGFRPRLDGNLYTRFGTHPNEYGKKKRPGVERLLFMGDSVTARSTIVDALRELYGDEGFEYWNAGVESFSTVQEVRYYERYNAAIEPDHVILTMHNNDLQTTPVAFYDKGALVIYAPNRPSDTLNPWLFRQSHLYRLWAGLGSILFGASDSLIEETEVSLLKLQALLQNSGIRLSVILLPVLDAERTWRRGERKSREATLGILQSNGFVYFDLLEPLNRAIEAGVDVQSSPGDRSHPGAEVSEWFAAHLFEKGLLEDDSARDPHP